MLSAVLLSIIGVIPCILAVGLAFRRAQPLEALPSIVWLFLIVVPFIYLNGYFAPETLLPQALGIATVSLALGAGDAIGAFRKIGLGTPFGTPEATSSLERILMWALAAYVVILPVIHLAIAQDIPFLHRLSANLDATQSTMLRENFSKLLAVPELLKIMFNWVIVVAGPILCVLLFARRLYAQMALAVVWCMAYALVSGARLPIILFAAITTIAIVGVIATRFTKPLMIVIIGFFIVLSAAGIYRGEVLVKWHDSIDWANLTSQGAAEFRENSVKNGLRMTPADMERIDVANLDPDKPTTFLAIGDYALYRAFLSPVEVSSHWYGFYPAVNGQWRPLTDLLATPKPQGWEHASNKVGKWAYVTRFPTKYFDSIHAYGSLDADAYAFGGLLPVALAGILLFLVRLCFAWFRGTTRVDRVISYLGIGFLSVFPFQASIQAILIPQGLAFLLALAIMWLVLGRPMDLDKIENGVSARPASN